MGKLADDRLVSQLVATWAEALARCSVEVVIEPARGNPLNHAPFKTVVGIMERLVSLDLHAERIGKALAAIQLTEPMVQVLGVVLGGGYTGFGLPHKIRTAKTRAALLEPLEERLLVMGTRQANSTAALIRSITGMKRSGAPQSEGVPDVLPLTVEGAIEFARKKGVLGLSGPLRQGINGVASEQLRQIYAHIVAIPNALATVEELPDLHKRFAALAEEHLSEASPLNGEPDTMDLRSYLPVERCTPFAVAENGDIFFLSASASDAQSGEPVVLRLIHDEATRVRPWARTVGEHLALVALAGWGLGAGKGDEVDKLLWSRTVEVSLKRG